MVVNLDCAGRVAKCKEGKAVKRRAGMATNLGSDQGRKLLRCLVDVAIFLQADAVWGRMKKVSGQVADAGVG